MPQVSGQLFEIQLPLPSHVCRMLKLSVHRDSVPEHSYFALIPIHRLPGGAFVRASVFA